MDEDEEEPGNDEAVVRAAARNESCADIELLPPLVEPILGGVLAVLKSSEYRGKRLDAVWSLTKSVTPASEILPMQPLYLYVGVVSPLDLTELE